MKSAMLLFKIVALFSISSVVDGQYHHLHPFYCNGLASCSSLLKEITSSEELAFAQTEQELSVLCGKLKEAVDCVNNFIGRCLDATAGEQYMAMTNGTQQLISELCTKGNHFREEYLKHAKCFRTLAGEYKKCAEEYYAEYQRISQNSDYATQIREWCCNFDSHRHCTFNSVLGKCGREAADLAQNIVKTAGGVVVEIHCQNYTHHSYFCSVSFAIKIIPSVMVILFLMTFTLL